MYKVTIGSLSFDAYSYEIYENSDSIKVVLVSNPLKFDIKSSENISNFVLKKGKKNIYTYDFNTVDDISISHYSREGEFTKVSFLISLKDDYL